MKQYTKFVIFSFLIGSINMYISKVSLVNYRNFENSFFLFNKGINTIIGENASGKTNLFRAIRLILDDNLLSSAYKLNENDFNRNLINWKGRWIIISLEFSEISNEEAIQALFVYGSGVIADDKVKKATYNLFFRPKPEIRKQLSELNAEVKNASTADGAPIVQYNTGGKNKLWAFEKQSSNASTRSFDLEQTKIATDFDKPEVMVDCKNDMILLDYPFKSPTELIVRILDLSGKQVYEGRRQVDGSNNVITISQFNNALHANQFYVISIRSADGKVYCSTKAIMSK